MQRRVPVLVLLALTQVTGWGAVGGLPVIAAPVAAEFGAALPSVFLGSSGMYVAMGLAAPWAGRAIRRFGARAVMAAGACWIALGLCLLALSPGLPAFWAGWGLTGIGGAMFLTTAAYAYLADHAGDRARSRIATLMLATGLAGSIFLPVTAFLDHLVGWRGALLAYAGVMMLVVCPLVRFGLPAAGAAAAEATPPAGRRSGPVFALMVAAIALNGFVTFGIEAVGIQLLRSMGMELAAAVAVASLLGVFKVAGRAIDLLGGRRWDGLATGVVAGAMIPMGLAAMGLGGAGVVSVVGFLLLFGVGSGAFAVARATLPLVFFAKADYAAALAAIALPMNLITALAAPAIAALMAGIGAEETFAVLGGLSVAAFAILLRLARLRAQVGIT